MNPNTSENWLLNAVAASGRGETSAFSGDSFGGLFSSVKKAVQGTGRSIRRTSTKINTKLSSVPVVGPGLSAVYKLGSVPGVAPVGIIDFAARVASGERVDKAAYNGLKERVKAYQDVAPYAQTVISFVPGVGPGVSGAIGAANALSKGQPITDAMIEGVRGAIPGGPLAQAAFDMAVAAAQGKPIDEVALNAIPLPPESKKYVVQGVLAAKDIAQGKPVDETLYNRGRNVLPNEASKRALDVGFAIAHGQKLQQIAQKAAPEAAPIFAMLGKGEVDKNPIMKAGLKIVSSNPSLKKGFDIALGSSAVKSTPVALNALRNSLASEVKKGFDLAYSAKIGSLSAKPISGPPAKQFGYFAAQGMKGAKEANKKTMIDILASDKASRDGVIRAASGRPGFFAWLKKVVKDIAN